MNKITPLEVEKSLRTNKPMHLIDVREADELKEGKIAGVIHIPLGLLESRMNELDKDTEYAIICRSDRRSGEATEFLTSHGYQAKNMVGGMIDWKGSLE